MYVCMAMYVVSYTAKSYSGHSRPFSSAHSLPINITSQTVVQVSRSLQDVPKRARFSEERVLFRYAYFLHNLFAASIMVAANQNKCLMIRFFHV